MTSPAEDAQTKADGINDATPGAGEITRITVANALDDIISAAAPVRKYINFNKVYGVTEASSNVGAQLQTAIDDCIANRWGLMIDPGQYTLEEGVTVGVNSGGTWSLFQMPPIICSVSAGKPLAAFSGAPIVQLTATFDDEPMLSIQGARGGLIQGIFFNCKTEATGTAYDAATIAQRVTTSSLYNNGQRQNRYSPECCVAVDPFMNGVPSGDRYPGVPTNYYTDTESYSSGITFRHCFFNGGEVGMLCSNINAGNCDGIKIDECSFSNSKYGISVCQGQTKNIVLEDTGFSYIWTCFTNSVHGGQSGRLPLVVHFGQTSHVGNLFGDTDNPLHPDSPVYFNGGHTEVVGMIGDFTNGNAGSGPVRFSNCSINFYGTPAATINVGKRMMEFDSCQFFAGDQAMVIDSDAAEDLPATWETGYITPRGASANGYQAIFRNTSWYSPLANDDIDRVLSITGTYKDWVKFENCVIRANDSSPYARKVNGLGSIIPLSEVP